MEKSLVRINSIEINNIKNTNYGFMEMPGAFLNQRFMTTAEILGIYGQNGSGKTAIIDTLYFLQQIMIGENIPSDMVDYICKEKNCASIKVEFSVAIEECKFEVGYYLDLNKTEHNTLEISKEALYSSKIFEDKRTNKLPFVEYSVDQNDIVFTPKKRFDEVILENKENKMDLLVAKKMARMYNCSYIFGKASLEIFSEDYKGAFSDYSTIIKVLYQYAFMDLIVIRNTHSGAISADFLLPMAFRIGDKKTATKGDFLVALKEPTVVKESRYTLLQRIVKEINVVLNAIIPGMIIGIQDYGSQIMENGEEGRRIELVSQRGNVRIPIRNESEGIIKIVSILNVLIRAYNNSSICLAIDELDAGIYEYLLGEILSVYNKGAKGQLIFTSHNLRPLEMLDKNSIIFSTANAENRFIRIPNVRKNNNLRDIYLRSITLGGQKECIYSETDSLKIARAFRKAGKELDDVW